MRYNVAKDNKKWLKNKINDYPFFIKINKEKDIRPEKYYQTNKFCRVPINNHSVWMFTSKEDLEIFTQTILPYNNMFSVY